MKSIEKRKLNILGNILFYLFMLILLLIISFTLLSKFSGGVPLILGNRLYAVVSGSMEPSIKTGSLVVVKDVDADTLEVDDVITYNHIDSQKVVTHRIVKISQVNSVLYFTTRGDANDTDDFASVSQENLIGKVTLTIPFAGRILVFANSKTGVFMLLIVPGILLIIFESIQVYKNVMLSKKKKEALKPEDEKEVVDNQD